MGNGFNFTFNLAPFAGALSSLANAIRNVFFFLLNGLRAVLSFTVDSFAVRDAFNLNAFGGIRDFFRTIWERVIKGPLLKLAEWYVRLKRWLDKTFSPLLKKLREIRKLLDFYFNKYVKPILNFIQRVRRILAIFRALHFKWADRLDKRLSRVESKIFGVYQAMRRKLNELASIINLIITPELLIRRGVLARSIFDALDDILVSITGLGLDFWAGVSPVALGGTAGIFDATQWRNDIMDAVKDDSGDLARIGHQARSYLDDLLAAAGR